MAKNDRIYGIVSGNYYISISYYGNLVNDDYVLEVFNMNTQIADAGAILSDVGLSDYIVPSEENYRGMIYDEIDLIYFILQNVDDSKYYLITYSISDDVFTVLSEYNISLMLDRNNVGSGTMTEYEKAFDIAQSGDRAGIYIITKGKANLLMFQKLVLNTGAEIIAITDNYLITDDFYLYELTNLFISNVKRCIITPEERRAWKCQFIIKVPVDSDIEDGTYIIIYGPLTTATVTTDPTRIFEGYTIVEDEDRNGLSVFNIQSPALFDLKNRTMEGEYSGRTDEIISDIIADYFEYITAGTMSAGGAQGDVIHRGRKTGQNIIDTYAQYDKFTWVVKPDEGQGLLNYNDGSIDSGVNLSQTDHLKDFQISKLRAIINQVNLKGAINPSTGKPFQSTKNNLASQRLYGIQPIYRTFAGIDTQVKLNAQAQSILTTQEGRPRQYEFIKSIGAEGLVLPSEEITLVYTPKSVTSGQRIIHKLEYHARAGYCKWTVIDALFYRTNKVENNRQEIEENSDLIEQNTEIMYSVSGGLVIYLHQDASADIGAYLKMCTDYPDDGKTEVFNATINADNQEIEQWVTTLGCPGVTELIEGVYSFRGKGYKFSGTKDVRYYVKIYKRILAGDETLLGTTNESNILADAEAEIRMFANIEGVALLATDRIVIKVFARLIGVGVNPVVYFYVEGDTMSRLTVPISAVEPTAGASDIPYNEATWNANPDPATKNVIRDKFELMSNMIVLEDRKASAQNGGTFTAGAWRTRVLNTETLDDGNLCTLNANQFTLEAGTYEIVGTGSTHRVQQHQMRIYNVTDGALILLGNSCYNNAANFGANRGYVSGKFTIAAGKALELQHYCGQTLATHGFGVGVTWGTNIFGSVVLRRID